ncbi:retrovirus-related pol polyprotein from transposon TNT 1-94 [Tanacetum coccineum]
MDRLSKRNFVMVCHEKVVRIPLEGDEIRRVHDERTQGVVKTLMNTKTKVSYDLVIFLGEHKCRLLKRGAWSSFEVSVGITEEVELYAKFTKSGVVKNWEKRRVKLRRVRAMSMTIQSSIKEVRRPRLYSKYEYEIRYHPGKANVVINVLRRKERVKPRREMMRTVVMDEAHASRFRWVNYLVVLADAAESVSDAIRFEYCLASSSGWTKRKPLEFEVRDRVLLKVTPWKGVVHFGKKGKLAPSVHDTFHVSNLTKCLADAKLHVPLNEIKIDKTLHFVEEPVEIMDREIRNLKHSRISLVKVRWNSKRGPEFTWEREDYMKSKYPQLFVELVKPLVLTCESVAIYGVCDFMCLYAFMWIMWEIGSQSIECDHLNEMGMVVRLVEFISFTLGDKEMILLHLSLQAAIGNSVISRVYYVEGLGHNLFSVGQFCDSDLEVAFRKHSCYVRDTDGVELLKGSRGSNLYTISVEDMMKSSPICLLSKASKHKSWLWHRRLNHLNFGTINDLARKDLVRGLPRLKFEKDHLCSACQLGKSKKHTHTPKTENTNLEVLNTLHMDLCGPMRVQTINGKKYILVIVDDYSRFTWVKFLRSKDETPTVVIKFLKQIQVGLNKTVRFIRTDNGTEFVNKTLYDYYESVGIFHQKTVPRTPQQNGVVERRNQTLVEAARTMLIFSKAPMFLWAEAVATACYTQNRSLIHTRHDKTPYELVHNKKPDLTFFRVFGALCYPTNDSENLGKLQPRADIGIFIGYAPSRKGYRIYNKRTRQIMETIHV